MDNESRALGIIVEIAVKIKNSLTITLKEVGSKNINT